MRRKKILTVLAIAGVAAIGLTGCNAKDTVSHNLSTSADNFEVNRRVVFMNGITDKYMLEVQGACAIEAQPEQQQLEVTCRLGPDEYKKHFLGLSDNVTYFVEQLESVDTSRYHYRVIFSPEAIIPEVDLDMGQQ